jgi:ferredoxin
MTKIFYFSGTGNSLWSAKTIARIINEGTHPAQECELFNIGVEAQKDEIIIEADTVVFVFPSYAYGLPRIVRRFLKRAVLKVQYAASFVTYGSDPLGTPGEIRRILKKKKIGKLYFGSIPSVENYLALFGPPNTEKTKRRVLMQEKATEEAAHCVIEKRENKVNTFCPFSFLVSRLFSLGLKIFYKRYRLGENCDGCGVCEKICPVSAIVMKNGRPVFREKCEHCQGCVDMCPLRAIQFGRVKFASVGYRHPQIGLGELIR